MAVTITTDDAGSQDFWHDDGSGAPVHSYRVIAGGALQAISTPGDSADTLGSSVVITFAPAGYCRAEGLVFSGTDDDLA